MGKEWINQLPTRVIEEFFIQKSKIGKTFDASCYFAVPGSGQHKLAMICKYLVMGEYFLATVMFGSSELVLNSSQSSLSLVPIYLRPRISTNIKDQ